jgi:hypothetical protein
MIIGGLALAIWGEERVTKDADVKVLIGDRTIADFRALVATRFPLREPPPGLAHKVSKLIVQVRLTPDIPADLLVGVLPYKEQAVRRAVRRKIAGVMVPVCTPEDLVIHKAIAHRPIDWMDIERVLLRQHDRLDQPYIEQWVNEFATALEQPEILTRYRELRARLNL